MCDLLKSDDVSITYPKFIEAYRKSSGENCTTSNYNDYLSLMTSTVPSVDNSRSWYWQTCAGFISFAFYF